MDKLEPLIRHKFWILFGITLPIALFGYYSASGKMAEATTSQETRLEGALNGVPKGDSEPNGTYAAGAQVINQELDKRFDVQVQKLWEMQTERMTWPKIVVPFVPDTYRGEIEPKARYTYARVYPAVIERLWERVQPYVGDPKTNRALADVEITWPQKVILDGSKIPHSTFDMSAPPKNEEVWDAQEDIWLLELIFDAVVRTNANAQFVSDAPVRQIDRIELVGGSGESSVTSTASATEAGGSGSYGDMMAEMYEDYGGGGGMGMGGMVGGPAKISFDVAEEFGQQIPEPTDESSVSTSASSSYGDMSEMYGGLGMMGGAGRKMQRYIGDSGFDPFEGPYRERGFYMSVIILQDRIPEFFAELSSSPWPIRIGRFQIGANPYASKTNTGGGGGYGMGGGYAAAMSGEYGSSYGEGETDYGGGGFGSYGEMSGGYGFGMSGGTAKPLKLPDYMRMPTSIPAELRSNPDLVQMDFCGIITMYNPVTDDSVEVIDDGSTEEDYQEQLDESPETPEEAQAMAAEAAAAAAQTTSSTDPSAGGVESVPAPAGNTDDGVSEPGSAGATSQTPPAESSEAPADSASPDPGTP